MKIFLDDIRLPSGLGDGWTIVRNYTDFFYTWEMNKSKITHIAFDHDLGLGKSGYDCLSLVEEDYYEGNINHLIIMTVHSSNPVGRIKMVKIIRALQDFMRDIHCKEV